MLAVWWTAARLGLCLGGIDEGELRRLRLRRLRLVAVLLGAGAFLLVLGSGVAAGSRLGGPPGVPPWAYYVPAALPVPPALAVWLFVRRRLRRALQDRSRVPLVFQGTARRLVRAREGGWPVLLRGRDGRRIWLTGNGRALAPIQARLARHVPGRPFRLNVTLTYHPRSRVIKEITGMAVENVEVAWSAVPSYGASPVRPASRWAGARALSRIPPTTRDSAWDVRSRGGIRLIPGRRCRA